MRPMQILHAGQCEPLKAGVHGAIGALAAVCAVYNLCALGLRPKRHLAINAVFYTALVLVEVQHVRHHSEPHDTAHLLPSR
jgi:hypothetical protein